ALDGSFRTLQPLFQHGSPDWITGRRKFTVQRVITVNLPHADQSILAGRPHRPDTASLCAFLALTFSTMVDKRERRSRRRKLLGAGARSLGRSVLHTVPGYDRARSWQKTGQDWFDTLGNLKGAAMKLGQI